MKDTHKTLFWMLMLFCIALQSPLRGEDKATYTITRDRLQHAGLARLSDIFILIDEWDTYSVEGFTYQGLGGSFDVYHQQNWIIMVDDHRMETKLFDINNINLLPISTNQIDSIEIYITPQLVEDAFSARGIIHIHTSKFEDGLSVHGQFTVGNQTGDPGPYRYTDLWSENIDRVASDESFGASYKGDIGYFGGGYYSQIFYPTDPLIADRNRDIYPYRNPYIKTHTYNIRAGLSTIFSRPRIDIVYSKIDDFYFFKPLGREIPVNNDFFSIGLIGQKETFNSLKLGYKFRYTRNRLNKRENAYDIYFNWATENIYANLNSVYNFKKVTLKLGVAVESTKIETGYHLIQNRINDGIVFGSLYLRPGSGSRLNLDAELRFNQHETGIRLAATNRWKINTQQNIFANIAYSQMMTNTENNIWYWSERGYNFVKDNGGEYSIEGALQPTRQWSFDIYWTRVEDIFPSIQIGLNFRGFLSKNWEEQPFEYDRISKTVFGPVTIRTGEQSKMSNIYLKLNSMLSPLFEHHLYFRYAIIIGSNGLFSRLRDEIPASLFIYRITYKPVKNFSIWAMCKYRSSTTWHDFGKIYEQSQGLYSANLSEVFLVDIAFNKWLWNRQIKVDLILRNILNQKNISYPIGSSPDLRIYAQAELYFNFW